MKDNLFKQAQRMVATNTITKLEDKTGVSKHNLRKILNNDKNVKYYAVERVHKHFFPEMYEDV